jgi:hypothetical protein
MPAVRVLGKTDLPKALTLSVDELIPDCMKKLYPGFNVSHRSPATKTHPPE